MTGLLPLLHRSYGHYVLQALPSATILAGAGLVNGWQWLVINSAAAKPWMPIVGFRHLSNGDPELLGGVIMVIVALALIDLPQWLKYLAYTGELVRIQARAAAAVERLTQPGEPILVVAGFRRRSFPEQPPAADPLAVPFAGQLHAGA